MIALRLAVLSLGVALGVFYPFISVILEDMGFSAAEIGLVASVGALGFTIAVPVWGHLADVRFGRARTLSLCAFASAAAVGLLIAPWPPLVIASLMLVFWVFESSWQPLADALTVNATRGRDYARVRLLTSLAFAVSVIAAGFVFNVLGYDVAFAAFAIAAVVLGVAVLRVPDVGRAHLEHLSGRDTVGAAGGAGIAGSADDPGDPDGPDGAGPAVTPGWRSFGSVGAALRTAPRLGAILTAVTLLHIGVIGGFTYLPLRLGALGSPPSDVALSAGVSGLAEVPAMLVAGRVAAAIGLRRMFVGSAVVYALALASWTTLESPAVIIATRAATGVAFAWVIVGVVLTISRLLPAVLQGTGQSLYQTVAFGVAAIVANLVGGLLYQGIGPAAAFGAGAASATAAAVLGWFVFPRDERPGPSAAASMAPPPVEA